MKNTILAAIAITLALRTVGQAEFAGLQYCRRPGGSPRINLPCNFSSTASDLLTLSPPLDLWSMEVFCLSSIAPGSQAIDRGPTLTVPASMLKGRHVPRALHAILAPMNSAPTSTTNYITYLLSEIALPNRFPTHSRHKPHNTGYRIPILFFFRAPA